MENNFENRFERRVWKPEPVRPQGPDAVLVGGHVFEPRGTTSGFTGRGECPWDRWQAINGVTEAVDATNELLAMMVPK